MRTRQYLRKRRELDTADGVIDDGVPLGCKNIVTKTTGRMRKVKTRKVQEVVALCHEKNCRGNHHHDVASHKKQKLVSNDDAVVVDSRLLEVTTPTTDSPHQSTKASIAVTNKIVFVNRPSDLSRIQRDEVQLVVWRRKVVPTFVATLSNPSIAPATLPTFIGTVAPNNAGRTIREKLLLSNGRRASANNIDQAALTNKEIYQLADDLDQLVRIFTKLAAVDTVHVRLECLDDNGCAFWHQDCVPFRLVTTYRGPCTEYVHPDFSNTTLRRRRLDSKHAQSLTHLDVAVFKGRGDTFYGDALLHHPGVVHRSPRMEGTGVYRVVLVLDVPADFHSTSDESDFDSESDTADDGMS